MSEFITRHPLGQDLEIIQHAFEKGLEEDLRIPEGITLDFCGEGLAQDGVCAMEIVDRNTENITNIYYPLDQAASDDDWVLLDEINFGLTPVRHRIIVRDLDDRLFPVGVEDVEVASPFLRFDVLDDSIVFAAEDSADDDKKLVGARGMFDGKAYDKFQLWARRQASIQAVLMLAARY